MHLRQELLIQIDELINKLQDIICKLSKSEYVDDTTFNEMIDILVNSIDEIHLIQNMNAEYYLDKTADSIVKIIELVNNGMESEIHSYIHSSILTLSYLKNIILNLEKKSIIIIGLNEYSKLINEIIDFNKVNILAYVSLGNRSLDINSELIINIDEMNQLEVDYYILMDEMPANINLNSKKVTNYWEYLKLLYFQSPEFSLRLSDFMLSQKDYEGIITGISYTELGIDENVLNINSVNLANPSQDLFYDFEMFKYGLEQSDNIYNIRYCIIGLCLYSFDYDLSLSRENQHRSIYYYPLVKSMHNYIYKDTIEKFLSDFEYKSKQIFLNHSQSTIFNKYKEKYRCIIKEGRKKVYEEEKLSEEQLVNMLEYIKKEFIKDYPETRIENKKIFRNYLELLKEKNIKAFVVIPPLSKFYVDHIPGYVRQRTIDIIMEVQKEYDFDFIDFSDKPFKDEHFTDGAHLNLEGSKTFTELLNQYIF